MGGLHELIAEPFERDDVRLVVSRLGSKATLADLEGRRGYLMVSVKNTNFTAQTVETFCDLAERHLSAGEVILVDTPYMAPILASESDGDSRQRKIANLHKAAADRRQFVEKILARRSARISIRDFDEVDRTVAPEICREVRLAFESGGRFREALLARSREVIPPAIPDASMAPYAEFLVSEIPVLCHLYYASGAPGVVDVYPGENPQLLWDIERGRYEQELPAITGLVAQSPGLIYVDIGLAARNADDGGSKTSFAGRHSAE
ncbi:MAG TPA: hypothetical protein VHQ39_09760 [Dongiaceae bacterium]|jgi:hypothetical protein|nr:hypothetical protein [Dongiaceae bacterium]